MIIGIIGLGHIGGSFSLGIQSLEEGHEFIGFDLNEDNANKALKYSLVNEITDYESCIKRSDLIVLATPVNVIERQLPEVLGLMKDHAVLIDLGSTKGGFCSCIKDHPRRARYVSCHPIAGTENSGPEAAFASLFKHKMIIICDKEDSDVDALKIVEELFHKLQMEISYMDAQEHDRHIAFVSHLSHITSFALGLTVLEKEKDEKNVFTMAGSGFSSTVRLAKSSPAMWAPIFEQNKENISKALDAYINQLKQFKEVIEKGDSTESADLMKKANDIRRVLFGMDSE